MNIGFVTPSISRAAGGIFEIERRLGQSLASLPDTTVQVFGIHDAFTAEDESAWFPLLPRVFPCWGPKAFGCTPGMVAALNLAKLDVAHLHALWMFTSIAINRWAKVNRRPYVVTLNGMLDPWAVKNSQIKKKLALLLYEQRCLTDSACIQVNSQAELRSARDFGLKNPFAIIPNGIDLPEDTDQGTGVTDPQSGRKTLLFLGRLHPKKGLTNALRAWAKIRSQGSGVRGQEEWQFVIAGWDQGGHEAELKRLCKDLGLSYSDIPAFSFLAENLAPDLRPPTPDACPLSSASVVFIGPAFGETKDTLLRRAAAFILPSFSEGLPMSVLEAWSYRLPVLMTEHCNLPEGFAASAALRIGTDTESIAASLHSLLASRVSDLTAIGDRGRALVERQFTWPMVAGQMKDLYEWVLGGGDKPGCVES